ncbi:MAG: hypothetical protein A3A86_07150 [Elusimicrobia bacterium RIFCSPLOWO2_01_FULL_60_11]|nr:MAG: hypothetical protein A3A86_07150 [Elusimicrobia bacterium RIFCSPLOWO2_01_FULL_60_11]
MEARISSLSPRAYSERLATKLHGLDPSVSVQNGWNGITPSGGDRDSGFILVPYQVTYGALEKLEVGASWGLQHVSRKNKSDQFGINDLVIAGKYRFFDADRADRSPGLDAELGFSFPTASFDKGLGTGAFGVLFGWGLALPLDPARLQVGMGYRLNGENSDDVRPGNVFSYSVGGSLPLPQIDKDFHVIGEFKGFNHSKDKLRGASIGSDADELYLAPGAALSLPHGMRALGQVLIGLTTDSSDAGFSFELQF